MQSQAQRLKRARIDAGYSTVAALARALGISEVTARSHENGHRSISHAHAARYAEALGVTESWLLDGNNEDSSPTFIIDRESIIAATQDVTGFVARQTKPLDGMVMGHMVASLSEYRSLKKQRGEDVVKLDDYMMTLLMQNAVNAIEAEHEPAIININKVA